MGPTNIALVKLFRADQSLREAQERLDQATKNVRVQERRVNDVTEKHKLANAKFKSLQTQAATSELDLKSRDAHVEKLREQQHLAKTDKEYKVFLIEINTQKVDKAKVEEATMALMEQAETAGKETADLATQLEGEKAKLAQFKVEIGDTITKLEAEISSLKGPRDVIAATLPPKARVAFDKLADHHDGEAMASIIKPDRRREEYACSGCMMDLVTDVYNKLHTRDDLVYCPSCRRILYIPDDLPPDMAVNKKKATVTRGSGKGKEADTTGPAELSAADRDRPAELPRAKGRLGEILAAAQGESVKHAVDAGQEGIPFHVTVDGRVVGIYKGKNAEGFERVIRFRFEEAGLKHEVHVNPVVQEEASAPAAETPATTETPSATAEPVEAASQS